MTSADDPLISTEWLAAHLGDPTVKVIDASFKLPGVLPLPVDDYLAAHIPGAVFFDVDTIRTTTIRGRICIRMRRSSRATSRRSAFRPAIRWSPTIRRLGRGAPGLVDVPVVRPCQCKGSGRRLEEMARRGPSVEAGKVTPKPGKFQARLDPS